MKNPPHLPQRQLILGIAALLLGLNLVAAQCAGPTPPMPPLPPTPATSPLQIAILSPTSGELATFGRSLRNGVQLALDQWNQHGGANSTRLEARLYPTDCSYASAQQALQQAQADGIQLAIGPLCTEAALGAAVKADTAQMLLISPTATHPLVTVSAEGQTRKTVFATAVMSAWQGAASAQFARQQLRANAAALLFNPQDHYFSALADAFSRAFTAHGATIAYRADVGPATLNFTDHITASRQAGAQFIYLPTTAATASTAAAQLQQLAQTGQVTGLLLLGSDTWDTPQLEASTAAASYIPTQFTLLQPDQSVQAWATLYKATYAMAPDTLAALGFDAANVLAQALNQAPDATPAQVAATLETITARGLTGPYRFDAGHTPLKPIPFLKVEQGQFTFAGLVTP